MSDRGGSRVWKGGCTLFYYGGINWLRHSLYFVEKVEDQNKKGEAGWVKEAAISL